MIKKDDISEEKRFEFDNVDFSKINFIFGYNGNGKTTLSNKIKDICFEKNIKNFIYNKDFTKSFDFEENKLNNDALIEELLNDPYIIEKKVNEEYLPKIFNNHILKLKLYDQNTNIISPSCYLENNKEKITPSEAEKTIIMFSVFLSLLYEVIKKDEKSSKKESILIFIDDPVTSMDIKNIINLSFILKSNIKDIIDKKIKREIQLFISTHHNLLFNRFVEKFNRKKFRILTIEKQNDEYKFKISKIKDIKIFGNFTIEIYNMLNNLEVLKTNNINEIRQLLEWFSIIFNINNIKEVIKFLYSNERKEIDNNSIVLDNIYTILNICSHNNWLDYTSSNKEVLVEDNKKILKDTLEKIKSEVMGLYELNKEEKK